jgi:hypothetical protein
VNLSETASMHFAGNGYSLTSMAAVVIWTLGTCVPAGVMSISLARQLPSFPFARCESDANLDEVSATYNFGEEDSIATANDANLAARQLRRQQLQLSLVPMARSANRSRQ